jgi:glutamine synthetase
LEDPADKLSFDTHLRSDIATAVDGSNFWKDRNPVFQGSVPVIYAAKGFDKQYQAVYRFLNPNTKSLHRTRHHYSGSNS